MTFQFPLKVKKPQNSPKVSRYLSFYWESNGRMAGCSGLERNIGPASKRRTTLFLFFNYAPAAAAACTFWKVVNNRTLQFKWAAGERRLELVASEETAEGSRPVLEIHCWSESLERDNSYDYQSPRKDSKGMGLCWRVFQKLIHLPGTDSSGGNKHVSGFFAHLSRPWSNG